MISPASNTGNPSAESPVTLAMAVLMDRVRALPEDDKEDLFQLSKLLFTTTDEEERNSAHNAMLEILEQSPGKVIRVPPCEEPGADLESWVGFVSGKIREYRKAASLTQQELARKSGIPQSHISRLENGEHSPSFVTLERIARALSIEVSALDPSA